MNFVKNIRLCLNWIDNNSTEDFMHVSSKNRIPYHEVTGYFIPTLINYGFRDKAYSYANYLSCAQKNDGSWNPHGRFSPDQNSYVFDVAQIIDGLCECGKNHKKNILKAIRWMESRIENGRFISDYMHPDVKNHGYMRVLYCLKKCGYDIENIKGIYSNDKSIYDFDVLSHFYGYAFEGCARLGIDCSPFIDVVKRHNGLVPERKGTSTYCWVALSQIALSLFICGQYEYGMKILEFVTKNQNESGGFYGSNGKYFPDTEISWAVKFYLDAFQECQKNWFKKNLKIFATDFEGGNDDKRLVYIKNNIKETDCVLDVGCGKGRYINRINCNRFACDIADSSKFINGNFSYGSCLSLPYEDNKFDVVLCCECLEHSIFPNNAIKECLRVLKNNGKLLIIDKDKKINFTDVHFGEEWLDFLSLEKTYDAEITEIKERYLGYPFYTATIIKQV